MNFTDHDFQRVFIHLVAFLCSFSVITFQRMLKIFLFFKGYVDFQLVSLYIHEFSQIRRPPWMVLFYGPKESQNPRAFCFMVLVLRGRGGLSSRAKRCAKQHNAWGGQRRPTIMTVAVLSYIQRPSTHNIEVATSQSSDPICPPMGTCGSGLIRIGFPAACHLLARARMLQTSQCAGREDRCGLIPSVRLSSCHAVPHACCENTGFPTKR